MKPLKENRIPDHALSTPEPEPTSVPKLPLARYRIQYRAAGPVQLPQYSGSAWRGALGHALKKLVCVTRHEACAPCALVHSCAHAYLFETPPPRDSAKMRKYPAVPHPFLLEPPVGVGELPEGAPYALDLTLFGHANRHLPYLLHAFERAGNMGIGRGRSPLQMLRTERRDRPDAGLWRQIHQPGGAVMNPPVDALEIPAPPGGEIRVEFLTPLRLRRAGQPVRPAELEFVDLFSNLLRRVSMLTYFHTDTPLETDFAGLVNAARKVEAGQRELNWRPWSRHSTRQKKALAMDGLIGSIVFRDPALSRFWPYLWLGQFVHAGSGTSMGQGRMRIVAV